MAGAAAPPAGAEEDGGTFCLQHLQDGSRDGSVQKVLAALDGGADPGAFDPWGLAPLHSAALGGHAEVIALLLDRQAGVDVASRACKTALHMAASCGHAAVTDMLVRRGADVLVQTGYGSTALDVARQEDPDGQCAKIITDEVVRRLRESEETTAELSKRLANNDVTRRHLCAQLGQQGEAVAAVDTAAGGGFSVAGAAPSLAPPLPPPPLSVTYWDFAARQVAAWRAQGEAALACSSTRAASGGAGAVPWSGELVARSVLPVLDPDDEELLGSYHRLGSVVEDDQRRLGISSAEEAAASDPEGEQRLVEETGKTMREWEDLVVTLRDADAEWDWSRLQVQQATPAGLPAGVDGIPATFAAVTRATRKGHPAFFELEVIGPLGGVLRRRSRYERLCGPPGSRLALHDPNAYPLRLRAQTPELRLEALVLDLAAGEGANRLRYLADARGDPLGLASLLGGPGPAGVFADGGFELPARRLMPRIRSRPGSPRDSFAEPNADNDEAAAQDALGAGAVATSGDAAAAVAGAAAAAAAANARIVEVMVRGWPYAFVVAARDICGGEQILVDRGEEYWAVQRAAHARFQALGQIGQDLVTGVDRQRKEAEPPMDDTPAYAPAVRDPMQRPSQ